MTGPLVLASRSPQRRALLEQLGIRHRVEPVVVEELAEGDPAELVRENARRKARAALGARVLGADTAVVLAGRAHGKPPDEAHARRLLERLSGRPHEVMGGIALRDERGERTAVAVTRVHFRPLSEREIDWYLASGEWRERAGGYAIQGRGAALVERIEGDYWNVVGLPLTALLSLAPDLLW